MNEGERSTQRTAVLNTAKVLAAEIAQTYPLRDARREFPYEEVARLKQSGLLSIVVPEEYGGRGLSIGDAVECTMVLATGNPSVAQLFLVHWNNSLWPLELMPDAQCRFLLHHIVANNAYLGQAFAEKHAKNAMTFETTFTAATDREGLRLNGRKFFTTGSLAADIFLVGGMLGADLMVGYVPKGVEGMVIGDDWDAMGQRGTASGTMEFTNVYVSKEHVFPIWNPQVLDPTSFIVPSAQIGFAAIYLGTAKGALHCAVEYVKTKTRPWVESGVEAATHDPYILCAVGHMQAHLSAAESLVLKAAKMVGDAWEVRGKLDREEMARRRAEAAVVVAEAKLVATEVALRVCQDIFQVCGARAALSGEDFDRFWRDVRTLTLHDPKDYKAKLIGEYLLQGKPPLPGGYN